MNSASDDPLDRALAWRAAGRPVALATVVRTWGSSPRPVGSHLAVDAGGEFAGSVSGGCIEGEVIQEALAVIADGRPRQLEFGVGDELAWQAGLACGGRVQVFVERLDAGFDRLMAARAARRPVAQVLRLSDGTQAQVDAETVSGDLPLPESLASQVRQRLASDTSGMLDEAGTLFVRIYALPPRLLIVGAVHIAQALAPMAVTAGYGVGIIDPRRAFASAERFPGVELSDEWPDEALQRLAPDSRTAVLTLTHDPKLDDPALAVALASPAFYIGALGSSRTHARRIDRLRELGLAAQIGRIHAPVGLDLGGRYPGEIAVSILAEIIRVRYKGSTT